MKKIITKISLIILILILNGLVFLNSTYAETIKNAKVFCIGDCGSLLKYKGSIVKVSYIVYDNNGVQYPAYCLDKTKPGAEQGEYTVNVNNLVTDVGLWRRVINGYPYKTLQELGVANKEEAFTATKQAIYCYVHGNNPNDYEGIGEAGNRTLNAMKKIIENANNSNATKVSSTITINRVSEQWEQDNIDKNYVSKTYNITSGANIENYKITLSRPNGKDLGGIKLTDEKNKERTEFKPSEKFKILIPIKNLTEDGNFNLKVETKINTKPVLYGTAPSSNLQDYALTASILEDGTGEIQDEYFKNETKITIVKKDAETKKVLEGAEFELLNEKKEVVYTSLKTDKNGKIVIKNLVPGKYYIKETKVKDGYEIYDELIDVEVDLNQEFTVTVYNNKTKKPKIEVKQPKEKEVFSKEVSKKEEKKLPVTGM